MRFTKVFYSTDDANAGGASETDNAQTTASPALPKTLDDVTTTYFPADKLEAGMALVHHISSATAEGGLGYNLIPNFDPEKYEFDGNSGLLVLPQSETVEVSKSDGTKEKVRKLKRIILAAVPTMQALANDAKGAEYIENAVLAAYAAKLRNAFIRVTDDAKAIADGNLRLPLTIADFVEKSSTGAQDQGLSAFNNMANDMVKMLGNKGIPINKSLLRQVLQSAQFANALFPKVAQGVWVKVLEAAKSVATQRNLKTDIFEHWIATRDTYTEEVAVSEDTEFSFG